MKYIIAILITLVLTALSVTAQEKSYKEYQPCTECFEQWKVSEGQTSLPETNRTNTQGRTRKPFKDTYVGQTLNSSAKVIVGTTLMIFTAIILAKATKPTVQ